MAFTKLFAEILDSTIWQETHETRLVWITLLAMADRKGTVNASIPGLAKRAGVTLDECLAALDCLRSPDEFSRSKNDDGRRIRDVEGGWRLVNHAKYREKLSAEERREYNRAKKAESRSKMSNNVNDMSLTVNDSQQCQHSTEAEAEADTGGKKPRSLSRARDGVDDGTADFPVAPAVESLKPKQLPDLALLPIIKNVRTGWHQAFSPELNQAFTERPDLLRTWIEMPAEFWLAVARWYEAEDSDRGYTAPNRTTFLLSPEDYIPRVQEFRPKSRPFEMGANDPNDYKL